MQLGKVVATGFVSDDTKAPADGEADQQAGGPDAHVPEVLPVPAPGPELTAAG